MQGHFFAIFTILIWALTFISTKILLDYLSPVQILFFRFVIGFLCLCLLCRSFKIQDLKTEFIFVLCGFFGVLLYFLLENIALLYTSVSNVVILVCTVPFFTALLASFVFKDEGLNLRFFIGFILAMCGVVLIFYKGFSEQSSLFGDFLALAASLAWACYTILIKSLNSRAFDSIYMTKRIFAYGILFILVPFCFDLDFEKLDFNAFEFHINLLFLGIFASALAFVTWGLSIKHLGAVKASAYIYAEPVLGVLLAIWILNEKLNSLQIFGMFLTLFGLFISETRFVLKVKK